jgi:hypothetical protein
MFLVIILTIIFPDEFWDSYSYHIYLQQNPFMDKINVDYFPGRTLTSFVFPIADRIFYMFRVMLGFRLGTLPGYLIIVVMYYEIKKILKYILKDKIKECYLSILSIVPLCTFIILQQMGTYYIDNFSVALLLEFVYIILTEAKGILSNKPALYYLALIVGIATCIKITNAIYMIGPLVYILVINRKILKEIKWYDYILLIITAFLPMLPYFINAWVQTGSPLFPYYNMIFKSEYFAEENWIDERYGPKSIIQFLIWPIYIIINPTKAYEVGSTDLAFASGYIIVIAYLLFALYKRIVKREKSDRNELLYITILFYFYLVWEKFIIGYTRYAGIIPVLATIFIIKIFVELIDRKKIIAIFIVSMMLCIAAYQGVSQYIYLGDMYNYIILKNNYSESMVEYLKENIRAVFKDRKNEKYEIDGIWGVIYDDSAVPMLLNENARLVHLEYGIKTGETEKSQNIYWENVLNNDIYVPLYTLKLDGKLEYLDKYHFEITEISYIIVNESFLKGDSFLYIVKVRYNEDATGNKEIFEKLLSEWE